jgi:hypothetical protein
LLPCHHPFVSHQINFVDPDGLILLLLLKGLVRIGLPDDKKGV